MHMDFVFTHFGTVLHGWLKSAEDQIRDVNIQ